MASTIMPCQGDMVTIPTAEYEELINMIDLFVRGMRNPKFTPIYFRLFFALINLHPGILKGEKVPVEVHTLREWAGWTKERVTSNFLQDMNEIGAFIYESGKYDKVGNKRVGYITGTNLTQYPESFDVVTLDRKKKAKEAEAKRRKQFKNPLQIMQCEECGSNNISWDATCRCLDCKHEHAPIKDIPASMITIEAEVIELADDVFFAPTEKIPVPSTPIPAAIQEELPQTPIPEIVLARHSRGWICDKCGQADKFVSIPTQWGGTMEICTCSE